MIISMSTLEIILNVPLKSKLVFFSQTNDALVAPLLRLPDNNCHQVEAEKVLVQKSKFNELIILYKKKNLHRKGCYLKLSRSGFFLFVLSSILNDLNENSCELLILIFFSRLIK